MGYGETQIYGYFSDTIGDLEYVAFSHSAPNIVGYSSRCNLFNLYDFNLQNSLQSKFKLECIAKSLCFNYDNLYCALGLENGNLNVIQLDVNKRVYEVKSHDSPISGIDFHPYSKLVVTSSLDNSIKVWDMRNRRCFQKINLNNLNTNSQIKFSPDGSWLCCTCNNETIIFDITSGKPLNIFSHENNMDLIEYHPNELVLAAICSNTAHFWDLDNFTEINTLCFLDENFNTCKFHQEGSCLFTGTNNGKITALGWETDDFSYTLNTSASNIYDLFHVDDKIYSIAAIDGKLTLFTAAFELSDQNINENNYLIDHIDKTTTLCNSSSVNKTYIKQNTFSLSNDSKYIIPTLSHTEENTPTPMSKELTFNHFHSSPICDLIVMPEFMDTEKIEQSIIDKFNAAYQANCQLISKRINVYISINRMLKTNNFIGAIKTAEDYNNADISKELIKTILNLKNYNGDFPYIPIIRSLKQVLMKQEESIEIQLLNKAVVKIVKIIQTSYSSENKRFLDEKNINELESLVEFLKNIFVKNHDYRINNIMLIISRTITRFRI